MCPEQPVDALACFAASLSGLIASCRDCANSLLQFLKDLKFQNSLPGADASVVRYTVQRIHALGEVRRAQSSLPTQLTLKQDVCVGRNATFCVFRSCVRKDRMCESRSLDPWWIKR